MRTPLTLIPIAWTYYVWLVTFSTFNPGYKTKFSMKKLVVMNLCAGGFGGILAAFQLRIKSKMLLFCFFIGSILETIIIYLIFIVILE